MQTPFAATPAASQLVLPDRATARHRASRRINLAAVFRRNPYLMDCHNFVVFSRRLFGGRNLRRCGSKMGILSGRLRDRKGSGALFSRASARAFLHLGSDGTCPRSSTRPTFCCRKDDRGHDLFTAISQRRVIVQAVASPVIEQRMFII